MFWQNTKDDGYPFGLSGAPVGVGTSRIPIPTAGSRHKDASIVIVARSSFPYEARVPAWLQGVVGEPPLEIAHHELTDRVAAPEGEAPAQDAAPALEGLDQPIE